MIRKFKQTDLDQVLAIWLTASIEAHSFIEPEFWEAKVSDMRDVYIPASETFVWEHEDKIAGFYSLCGDTLAAIFVDIALQGKGLGTALLDDARSRRDSLQLSVYKENVSSLKFYEKYGFTSLGEQVDEHTGHIELIMRYDS
ncbi:MAG: N-acetyltransferase [Pseudohongiella sp.]|nr:N-acetyltransferase [Pseudohongiella sp.]